jgi:superfamily II RNA helicase
MSFLNIPDISKTPEVLPPHPYSFPLDPFQQHAIYAISRDENVLVCAKTGSGKTLVGEYQIFHSLNKGKRVFYTTPIKSLSNQKFHDLKTQFKNASVGIMTGDIKFRPDAQIVIMTTEILRNLLYKKGTTTENLGLTASISMDDLDAVIFDECHYINDKDRGKVWEETMILLPPEINLVMLSATLDHPEYLAGWLGNLKQKPIHLIETQYRIVPLTHYLLDKDYKLLTLMDHREVYDDKKYLDWLKFRGTIDDERRAYQRKVADARRAGTEGAIDGKVHTVSFVHQMNETIKMLDRESLMPALFFVLSRKQCEAYAAKVEGSLLTTSDTATVKHIISFHLHRHMKDLEILPQYHQIHDLLCRGIAFHHSGLLPLLKEIVEILFAKGLVRIMFCTETFAVGLNMPTKTVLFAGLKKYDDQTGGMRMLRNDEYLQMAGRAGRRGKDDKGVVIYLPDRDPVDPRELKTMMKGTRPPILSRMDFHYDFILKTIQASEPGAPLKWLQIMEESYWFQQRQQQINGIERDLTLCRTKIGKIILVGPLLEGSSRRAELEQQLKITSGTARRDVQRQLDALKNKQLGPAWVKAWADFQALKALLAEEDELKGHLVALQAHSMSIVPTVKFLAEAGYLKNADPLTLKNEDLTLRGILATEINQGHQLIMTELYIQELLHSLTDIDLVCVLACFQEDKETEESPSIAELKVSSEVRAVLYRIQEMVGRFQDLEDKCGSASPLADYWRLSTQMIEPMRRWVEGESAAVICTDYGLFEGNFIRAVMKMTNMLDEWLALATYCQHTDQIDKIMGVRNRMIRDIVISDSLYLHL